MSRKLLGVALIVFGLALVGAGIWVKRGLGRPDLLIWFHTSATLFGLLPGAMLLAWKAPATPDADA